MGAHAVGTERDVPGRRGPGGTRRARRLEGPGYSTPDQGVKVIRASL